MTFGSSVALGITASAYASGQPQSSALEALARIERRRLGEVIYRQQEPADYWYRLVHGAARKSAVTADGRRHIVSFLVAGDLFGFGAAHTHRFTVHAISPVTVVARYSRRRAEMLAESNPDVARQVREAAFNSVARLQGRGVLLGRNGAIGKLAAFLLEMLNRAQQAEDVIDLPMSRYDIADYLSIAVETVSRSLTTMRGMHLIALVDMRRVKVIDRIALQRIADAARDPGALSRSTPMSFGSPPGIPAGADSLPIEVLRSSPERGHHGLHEPLVLPAQLDSNASDSKTATSKPASVPGAAG